MATDIERKKAEAEIQRIKADIKRIEALTLRTVAETEGIKRNTANMNQPAHTG